MHRRQTLHTVVILIVALGTAACGDDPFALRWTENPEEVTIQSLDRPGPQVRAGFNLFERTPVRIEAPQTGGRWDFALEREGETLRLLPPRTMGIQDSSAGISPMEGAQWDDIREAPRDTTAYTFDEPVPVRDGTIYVGRTHEQAGSFGRRCIYYGKLEPVVVDVERGALTFRFDVNPDCNNRSLVPPGS